MTEDLSVFFYTDDFAVAASFTPVGGGAAQTADVILDSPTERVLGGEVLSEEYTIMYRASDLPGITAGAAGTVGGTAYTVREITYLDDGALKMALLTKT